MIAGNLKVVNPGWIRDEAGPGARYNASWASNGSTRKKLDHRQTPSGEKERLHPERRAVVKIVLVACLHGKAMNVAQQRGSSLVTKRSSSREPSWARQRCCRLRAGA